MRVNEISLLGVDLAKNTFQLHGINKADDCILRKKLNRNKFIDYVTKLSPCKIVMEACSGAHYFARKFQSFGHEVKLIAPHFVKPYVQGNKNDAADAHGITEAASRASMRYVAVKETWQQDIQSLHRIRSRLVKNRTAVVNETRGILAEYGIVIPAGRDKFEKHVPAILNHSVPVGDLNPWGFKMLQDLYSEYLDIDKRVKAYEVQLNQIVKDSTSCQNLLEIQGIGLLSASGLISALGDGSQFKNGRHFSAWLGLVPKHAGTGGFNRVLNISKRGDKNLRYLLIHGARSSLRAIVAKGNQGKPLSSIEKWAYRIYESRGWNKACVAIANKNARIAWAMTKNKENYNRRKTNNLKLAA